MLTANPSSGYIKEIQDDKYKKDIITEWIGSQFTDRHADIKAKVLYYGYCLSALHIHTKKSLFSASDLTWERWDRWSDQLSERLHGHSETDEDNCGDL